MDGDIETLSGQSTILPQIALETEDGIPGVQGCIGLVSSNPQQKLLANLDPPNGPLTLRELASNPVGAVWQVSFLLCEIAKVIRRKFVGVQHEAAKKSPRVWKMLCEGLGSFTRPDRIESNSKNASLGGFLRAGHHGMLGMEGH